MGLEVRIGAMRWGEDGGKAKISPNVKEKRRKRSRRIRRRRERRRKR